ncbi:MAG: hypothetical protein JWL85_336 [Candidatus Saccharibacteria bacterium]|nr:hypothetical protein [Candidatus Saccharibacteria bacterium]
MELPRIPTGNEHSEPSFTNGDSLKHTKEFPSVAKGNEQERIQTFQHLMEGLIARYRDAEATLVGSQGSGEKRTRAASLAEKRAAEELMKTVAAAAERNTPIEAMYERSHEIKDVPTTAQAPTGAVQAGKIAANNLAHRPEFAPHVQHSQPSHQDLKLSVRAILTSPVYMAAIMAGFGAAVLLLIVILITSH